MRTLVTTATFNAELNGNLLVLVPLFVLLTLGMTVALTAVITRQTNAIIEQLKLGEEARRREMEEELARLVRISGLRSFLLEQTLDRHESEQTDQDELEGRHL